MSRLAAAAALVALAASPAAAQVSGGAGAYLESYSFGEAEVTGFESITLLTTPFGAAFAAAPGVEITLGGAFARGEMTLQDGSNLEISGLTDTSLRTTWTMNEYLTLSGAVFLPTGKVEHTFEEARVAGAIAYDLLPFRISNWGTGGGADASAAVAVPLSESASVGARVGYRLVSEYEPFAAGATSEAFVYDPGDQLYVRGAIDANVAGASKLSLSVTWQTFGEDAREGTNLFRSGDRITGQASLVFPTARRGSGWIYGGVMHRSEGSFLTPTQLDDPPSQDVFFAGGGARFLTGGGLVVLPNADVRALRTEDGLGQGVTAGVGASLEIPLGAGPELVPTGKLRFGNVLVSEDAESGFFGYEIGLSVRGIGR